MFVHADHQHALNNLFAALVSGKLVGGVLGYRWMYAIFYCGGMVSSQSFPMLGLPGLKDDFSNANKTMTRNILPKVLQDTALSDAVGAFMGYFSSHSACGSSGGVAALLGATTALALDDLYLAFKSVLHSRSHNASASRRFRSELRLLNSILKAGIAIQGIASMLVTGERVDSNEKGFTFVAKNAHLRGAAFGALTTLFVTRSTANYWSSRSIDE